MNDMISVIIPTYNRQSVITECIQSVLTQSYQNFEIILIDDGSTDKTLEICRELQKTDSRIVLLSAEHGGVSAARNKGIDAAQGEYLFFLDSDDVIHPLLLEALVTGLKNSDASIAGTKVLRVRDDQWNQVQMHIQQDPGPAQTTYHDHADTLDAVFHSSTPINVLGGVMLRRDLIGETRFRTDLFIGEDFYFIYENLAKGASCVFLDQVWYYCRLHASNSSWNYSYAGFWTRFHRRELVWKSEESFGRTEYANCEKRNAFACFLLCLKKNPPHSEDAQRMRNTMKQYRHDLLPALSSRDKACYWMSVYTPSVYFAFCKLKSKIKKWFKH